MSTVVKYNGIELHNVLTRQWDQEIVYEPSDTDVERHRYTLTFEGTLHADTLRGDVNTWIDKEGGDRAANTTVGLARYVEQRLWVPRRTLEVLLEMPAALAEDGNGRSDQLLVCFPATGAYDVRGNIDVNNGPHPKQVSITQITADKLLRVRFTIECSKLNCQNGIVPYVISNRWSVGETMDDNFFTTRTIRGRLRLSNAHISPQVQKGFTIPLLEPGFKRERIEFVASENGLEAAWSITDKQVHTAAPWPATKINGTYTESTADGIRFVSEVNVRLEGSPDASRAQLIQRALQVVDAKCGAIEQLSSMAVIPLQIAITEHIGEVNAVDVLVRYEHVLKDGEDTLGEHLTNLRTKTLAQPLLLPDLDGHAYHPTISRTPAIYGYNPQAAERAGAAALLLLHCAMKAVCTGNKGYIGAMIGDVTGQEESPATQVDGYQSPGDLPPSEGDLYHPSTGEGLYVSYTLENRYSHNRMRVQLPLAAILPAAMDTCVVATLSNGQARREINIEGSRVGNWPEIPAPVDFYIDGNLTGALLKDWNEQEPPSLSADGRKKVFHIRARYVYALNRPPTASESTRVGVLPFTKVTQDEAAITRSEIYKDRLAI